MNRRRMLLLAALSIGVAACASLDRGMAGTATHPAAAINEGSAARQILVMLRLAPPHFHPDANYAGGSDAWLSRDARRRVAQALASEHGLKLVTDWPMPALGVDCFLMEVAGNYSTDDSPARLVEKLSLDPRVESVQPMNLFHALGHNDPLYPLQPSAKLWHLAELHEAATGRNIRVAEIDTGVEIEHPDLRGQVVLTRNFVDDSPYTGEAHGTAVAGIIAARADDGIGIAGVAPQARLMVLRACWQDATGSGGAICNSFTLAKALQFALDREVQVINLSLGGPRDRLLQRLLDVALSQGITIVGAVDPEQSTGGFPASHPGVLAVAGDESRDLPAGVFLAPGHDIPTTALGGRWRFVAGTSFAAAHVTGMVALLRELTPRIQSRQVHDALAAASASSPVADRPMMIDACAALGRTTGSCVCACAATHEARSLLRQ